MVINYEGIEYVVDPSISFIMPRNCYTNGMNCLNCYESFMGDCPMEEINEEDIFELANNSKIN